MFQAFIFSMAFAIYAFAAVVVWRNFQAVRHLPAALLAFLALNCCIFVLKAWIHIDATPLKALALGSMFLATHALPYSVLFYARSALKVKNLNMSNTSLVFTVIGCCSALPLMSTSHFGHDYQTEPALAHQTWFWINAASLLSVACFLICTAMILGKVKAEIMRTLGLTKFPWTSRQRIPSHNTLRLMWLSLVVLWGSAALSALHCLTLGPPSWVSLIISMALAGLSVAILTSIIQPLDVSARGAVTEAQYARSGLSDDDLARIHSKLESAMCDQCLYTDAELTLARLSKHVSEKSSYVSQCLSQKSGLKFSEYVNHYRVLHAKKLLVEQLSVSILDVCLASGFQSKSTFYSAFKKSTGIAPSAYRTQFSA